MGNQLLSSLGPSLRIARLSAMEVATSRMSLLPSWAMNQALCPWPIPGLPTLVAPSSSSM